MNGFSNRQQVTTILYSKFDKSITRLLQVRYREGENHRDEFNLMKLDYEASPLRLYRGESLVEPADANEALTGAVVQVILHHPTLLFAREKIRFI